MESNEGNLGKTITLSDGRKLGYIERGDPNGKAIFYFPGWPSSRLELLLGESFTTFPGIRMISIDRPGIGLSDFKKKRKILDLADDIVELADFLNIEKFSIIGLSGGAPFAHGCAYKIPGRLNSVGIISGLGPFYISKEHMSGPGKIMLSIGRFMPWLMGLFLGISFARPLKSKNQEKAKEHLFANMLKDIPEPDKKLMEDPVVFDAMWEQMKEVFRNGTKGATQDGALFTKSWGFELKDIPKEVKFFLWHGELDANAPIEIGKAVAKEIPHCVTKYFPEEGHFSLILNNFNELTSSLVDE